jgi:hypothetical protein
MGFKVIVRSSEMSQRVDANRSRALELVPLRWRVGVARSSGATHPDHLPVRDPC